MTIEMKNEGGVAVIAISGSLDAEGTQKLEETVVGHIQDGTTRILFDFSELDYINSSGLRVLVLAYQKLKPAKGQVGICGVKDYIREVFEISGYDKIFAMFADRSQGVAGL